MCCHARMRTRVQSPATMWKGGHVLHIPWSQWWRSGQMDFRSSWPASPADHQGVWGSVRDCSPLSHPPKVELHTHQCKHNTQCHTHSPLFYSAFYGQYLEHLPCGQERQIPVTPPAPQPLAILNVLLLDQWHSSYLLLPGRMTNQEARVMFLLISWGFFFPAVNE